MNMIWDNGFRKMTSDEEKNRKDLNVEREQSYWLSVSYDDAVDNCIRDTTNGGYTVSQEFAILRQKENKPEEWAIYNAYCEEQKRYVQNKFREYGRTVE